MKGNPKETVIRAKGGDRRVCGLAFHIAKKGGDKMKKILIFALPLLFLFLSGQKAHSGELDILLENLVEKGVITQAEARQIKIETEEQVRREIAEGKASGIPGWVQSTKLKGDLRVRFQRDHTKKTESVRNPNRDRVRMRLRLGLESKVNKRLNVEIGIATGLADGSSDASRSTNVTFENSSSKKPMALDYASASATLSSSVQLLAGKFRNPLWEPGDLIWDTDINPEGAVLGFSDTLTSKTKISINGGVLVLDEIKDSGDPLLYVLQAVAEQNLAETMSLKAALSYYDTDVVKGRQLDGTAKTNSNTDGKLLYEYSNLVPAFELVKRSLGLPFAEIPYLALFGEYVKNTNSDVKEKNTGYMLGFKIGAEKVKNRWNWQMRYNYAKCEKDAFLDILPDSDRYGGSTGMRAHEAMFDFGIAKNTWLGLDFYYGEKLTDESDKKPKTLLQVDWNMRF